MRLLRAIDMDPPQAAVNPPGAHGQAEAGTTGSEGTPEGTSPTREPDHCTKPRHPEMYRRLNQRSHRIFRRYAASLPTSLSCINSTNQRLLAEETCCGDATRRSILCQTTHRSHREFCGVPEHDSLLFWCDAAGQQRVATHRTHARTETSKEWGSQTRSRERLRSAGEAFV